jgi:hypothetical protein
VRRVLPLARVFEEEMTQMQLHPIMYVPDQYAERDFYELFGFQRHYEGDEFPGFLAMRHGPTIIGLQRASTEQPAYTSGLRWQFQVDRVDELEAIISTCVENELPYEVIVEEAGASFGSRIVTVRSPAAVMVWFEGPNEARSSPP